MKSWLDSNTIRSLAASAVLLVLGWLTVSLTTGKWDWKDLSVALIALVIPLVKRLADPDVTAPFAVLNRSNPQP